MEIVEQIFLVLAYVAGLGFLISGLDDLFFDSHFLLYLFRNRKAPNISLQELKLAQEQWVALLVPAWQEGGVVNKMAEYAARVILYEKYHIFIGVYPNDPETIACVDRVVAENPRIHKVMVPHAGPTSKADCLNALYRAMRQNEVPGVREFGVIALHDAEDILHPLVVKVYNYFVPREYDMAQVPVFALELPSWKYWAGNTYIDDFSELHTKDLFVRQSLGGIVPSAGVGTAFSRRTLDWLAAGNGGDPFLVGNLTEDYEVGIRVKRAGFRAGIVSYPVDRLVRRKKRDGTLGLPKPVTEIVAIRENFPKTFWTAVRQRSRWILGISFQTWEQAGWAGTLPMRYTLLRDRRAPLTHFINMLGYLVLVYLVVQWAFRHSPWANLFYVRPLLVTDSVLLKIAIIDTGLLGYRVLQKMISVYVIYNFKQALASAPRMVIGNLINFMATVRALKMYLGSKLFGKPFVWLKTAHEFPGEAELTEYQKSIEDLLVEEGLATREQIYQALRAEQGNSAPLCLLQLGLIDERSFSDVWRRYSGLGVRFVNPREPDPALLRDFRESDSLAYEALPVSRNEISVQVAFREPPSDEVLSELGGRFGMEVRPFLARPSNIAAARNWAYPRLVLQASAPVADVASFRQAARLNPAEWLELLQVHQSTGQSVPDLLVDQGRLTGQAARDIWARALGVPAVDERGVELDRPAHARLPAPLWWFHRLLPVEGNRLLVTGMVHPHLEALLAEQGNGARARVAELPSRFEWFAKNQGAQIDPENLLLKYLAGQGHLSAEDMANIEAMQTLIADPVAKWLLMQRLVDERTLHRAFLEASGLPIAGRWREAEIRRLKSVLPPGFAVEHGCHCLEEGGGHLRIGLAQMPSARVIRRVQERLTGYGLFFQALTLDDAAVLRELSGRRR